MNLPRLAVIVDPVTGVPAWTLAGCEGTDAERHVMFARHVMASAGEGLCPSGHAPREAAMSADPEAAWCSCDTCGACWWAKGGPLFAWAWLAAGAWQGSITAHVAAGHVHVHVHAEAGCYAPEA